MKVRLTLAQWFPWTYRTCLKVFKRQPAEIGFSEWGVMPTYEAEILMACGSMPGVHLMGYLWANSHDSRKYLRAVARYNPERLVGMCKWWRPSAILYRANTKAARQAEIAAEGLDEDLELMEAGLA